MAKPTFASSLQESLDSEIAALKVQRDLAPSEPEERAAPAQPSQQAPAPPAAAGAPAPAAPRRAGRSRAWLLIVGAVVVLGAALLFILVNLATFGNGNPAIQPTTVPGSGTAGPGTPTPAPVTSLPPSALTTSPLQFLLAGLLVVLVVALVALVMLRRSRAQAALVPAVALAGPGAVGALNQRIVRLEQLRTWMGEDPDLGRLIDTSIGSQVRASERRQRLFAGTLGVITLIAGWLLSAVSPPAALASFLHLGH